MSLEYIARHQIIEQYLSGRLPPKTKAEFERFCRENPDLLGEIGMADRVQTGMELLVASGHAEPPSTRLYFFQRPQVIIWLVTTILALGASLWIMIDLSAAKDDKIHQLQRRWAERPLDLATSTREIRLLPSRDGGSPTPAIEIGGSGAAQLVDFRIDETRSPYKQFSVTIDRIDQGRVGVISNLVKDPNGHLRIALNSTALGPGVYQLTIEGLTPSGGTEPDSWVTIGIKP
jgi:hypothetical protein